VDVVALGPRQRARDLARMRAEEFDILVVGGGVTGAGVALDAASRGLRAALVERRDYACGTSSRSGKVFHGGLRYLERLNLRLVREALRERDLMVSRLCPYLTRPTGFLFPLTHAVWERPYAGLGMALYDSLGGGRVLPRHRHLTRRAALREAPGLRSDALVGAVRYHDAVVDDARHTLMLVRTAASLGVAVANDAAVVGLARTSDTVTGALVRAADGEPFTVRARRVVAATGVWTDDLYRLAGAGGPPAVRAAKGVHILVPRDRFDARVAITARTATSQLVIRPWGAHWLIGTTDTDWPYDRDHPVASASDVDYLLAQANRLVAVPLRRADVTATFAGLRPLAANPEARLATASAGRLATARLSRDHRVDSPVPGLVTVTGGKYTTYRVMARDAVDAAVRDLGYPVPRSATEDIRLVGADGPGTAADSPVADLDLDRLRGRYGSLTADLLAILADRPDLARPVPGAAPYRLVEAHYAASHEGARHLDDVLARRLHVSYETADRGARAAGPVADVVGEVLGWDAATRREEVRAYGSRIAAELAAASQPDDESTGRRMADPD
jgi:glycerol-3-phosphate dehydrogenase